MEALQSWENEYSRGTPEVETTPLDQSKIDTAKGTYEALVYKANLILRNLGESTGVAKSTRHTAWLAEANLTANKEETTSANRRLASLKHDVTNTYQAWIEARLNGGDVDKEKKWYGNAVLSQKEHNCRMSTTSIESQ